MKSELVRFGRGFVYAWTGIKAAVREERNFRFHLTATCYAYAAAYLAELDAVGYCLITFCVAGMLGMELMNSAVERAVDQPDTTHWDSAGAAKDMAAGGVLMMALGSVLVAAFLLGPRLGILWANATATALQCAVWPLTLVAAYRFVFCYRSRQEK